MKFDTNAMMSVSEANQNFSKACRLADQNGSTLILKNNAPKYILVEFSMYEKSQTVSDDELFAASAELMQRNHHVYEELAK